MNWYPEHNRFHASLTITTTYKNLQFRIYFTDNLKMKNLRLIEILKNHNLTPECTPDPDLWKLFLSDLDSWMIETQHDHVRIQQHAMTSANSVTLGELVGGISHEINNPLAVIQLRSDQLLEMVACDDFQPEFFTKSLTGINGATRKIGDIITAVRSILKHDTNQPPTFCSLKTITEQAIGLHKHKFSRAGISLEIEPADDIVVEFVPPELSHIVFYLLDNAFDAALDAPEKWVRLQTGKTDTEFFITVTDSGSGIAKADQPKIMNSFFSTKDTPENAGIGLYLTQKILSKHNGRVQNVSESPNTQFRITCPLTQANDLIKQSKVS